MFNILKSTKYFSSYNHLFKFNLSSNVFTIHEQHYKTLRVFSEFYFSNDIYQKKTLHSKLNFSLEFI